MPQMFIPSFTTPEVCDDAGVRWKVEQHNAVRPVPFGEQVPLIFIYEIGSARYCVLIIFFLDR